MQQAQKTLQNAVHKAERTIESQLRNAKNQAQADSARRSYSNEITRINNMR